MNAAVDGSAFAAAAARRGETGLRWVEGEGARFWWAAAAAAARRDRFSMARFWWATAAIYTKSLACGLSSQWKEAGRPA